MTTLLISDPLFLNHRPPEGHPERPDRLLEIEDALSDVRFTALLRTKSKAASEQAVRRVHNDAYIDSLLNHSGERLVDPDTWFGEGSLIASLHGAGAACQGVDAVMTGQAHNVFCAVRPPGHHAEHDKAMGFCLINNVAVAARYAQDEYKIKRVAIVDFDVHHGNGTQDIFQNDASVFYASTHQSPCFPGTGSEHETGVGNILNIELAPGTHGPEFRDAYQHKIFPALETFKPDLLIISAGFDAHWRDPLAQLEVEEDDFAFITQGLKNIAAHHCNGRLVSVLEGGYDLQGLSLSVAAHIKVLMA